MDPLGDNAASETNRKSWNAATRAHNRHKGDQAAPLRAGQGVLFPEEIALLGPVVGERLLHLQCNSGQDTLSLALLGAQVTGVDISDEAIAFARQLSEDSGVPGTFYRDDVLSWLHETPLRFDRVFTSYGAIGWLSDLGAWATGIHRVLEPGGRFTFLEFHPFAYVFDDQMRLRWPYSSGGEALDEHDGVSDYVGERMAQWRAAPDAQAFVNPHPSVSYAWGVADILNALVNAGLRVDRVEEYAFSNGFRFFDGMERDGACRWVLPAGAPALPLMLGINASRAE